MTRNVTGKDLPSNYYMIGMSIFSNSNTEKSYLLMEKLFKIFVYKEGEPPLFHYGPCKNIYSMEGMFINLMEANNHFQTLNPDKAHVYFLPFSVVMILEHLFDPIIRDKAVLERILRDYVRTVSTKYPYWNRSLGADHFMLSSHDWGPRATWYVHQMYFTSIRVLCNANTSEFFNPRKDVPLPEINLLTGNINGLVEALPKSNKTILGFFAGRSHGRIRPILFRHWEEKDEDIRVYSKIPPELSYDEMMKSSKFCLCPSGYEVASPRIVEAIYANCVPVLISQNYVLPFSDVLDWDKFSIQVSVSELPNLKNILLGISEERYEKMVEGVRQVQRHFVINDPPKRYDVFHMIIHSIWLRRLNVRIHG
ncbi:probable glycosyltransferase At3g07620 [Nicotiana sylvestris]|uniref:probable glycosyltransferase At3g07620 n=1 Tax=Nicotiana sylvestris TaxID=4096 RepID=UPI00388CA40F